MKVALLFALVVFTSSTTAQNGEWLLASGAYSSGVCFSSLSFSTGYEFNAPYAGEITGVKLVHASGTVTCGSHPGTYWGCEFRNYFMTFLLKHDVAGNAVYYPTTSTDTVTSFVNNWGSCANGCPVHAYTSNTYGPNSNELILMDASTPYVVDTSDIFSLQFSEGCCLWSTNDNAGDACGHVYFYYTAIPTTAPTGQPTAPSKGPTLIPTNTPTHEPTVEPTTSPTIEPTLVTQAPSKPGKNPIVIAHLPPNAAPTKPLSEREVSTPAPSARSLVANLTNPSDPVSVLFFAAIVGGACCLCVGVPALCVIGLRRKRKRAAKAMETMAEVQADEMEGEPGSEPGTLPPPPRPPPPVAKTRVLAGSPQPPPRGPQTPPPVPMVTNMVLCSPPPIPPPVPAEYLETAKGETENEMATTGGDVSLAGVSRCMNMTAGPMFTDDEDEKYVAKVDAETDEDENEDMYQDYAGAMKTPPPVPPAALEQMYAAEQAESEVVTADGMMHMTAGRGFTDDGNVATLRGNEPDMDDEHEDMYGDMNKEDPCTETADTNQGSTTTGGANEMVEAYINEFGQPPQSATQLMNFIRKNAKYGPITFKQARDLVNEYKETPQANN